MKYFLSYLSCMKYEPFLKIVPLTYTLWSKFTFFVQNCYFLKAKWSEDRNFPSTLLDCFILTRYMYCLLKQNLPIIEACLCSRLYGTLNFDQNTSFNCFQLIFTDLGLMVLGLNFKILAIVLCASIWPQALNCTRLYLKYFLNEAIVRGRKCKSHISQIL